MSLDLTRVAGQVSAMISRLRGNYAENQRRLRFAVKTLNSPPIELDELKKKIAASRTTWLVAEIVEGLNRHYSPPPLPQEFTVAATDGSHIDVDRHHSTRCYLINIGEAVISYGRQPDARLSNIPHLYSDDQDLVISPPGNGRQQMVEGTVLGAKRNVEECRRLAEIAVELPQKTDCLALLDGTLIMWGLEAYPDFVTDVLLDGGLLKCLEAMRNQNTEKNIALASYISYPRSADVVNVLRVAICPKESIDSDKTCKDCISRECEALAGVHDRDIFMDLLGSGERSALFISPSRIVKERYGEHRVHFFYLRVEDEIARIEVPQWVAESENLLNLAHSLIIDQCRRGHGYPVVLSEAHEQAVVTGADRESFWELVESSLVDEHMPSAGSAKSLSKKTRWI